MCYGVVLGGDVEELAHATEFFVARVDEFAGRLSGKRQELALEDVAEELGGAFVIAVRSAVGLRDDFVDNAEFLQIVGHDLHGDGRSFGLRGVAPDDGSAAFRRDHGVKAVFENVHFVADGDGERAAGPAFTGNGDDYWNREPRHFAEIARNGFALSALFGVDTGVSAGRVDEREDRKTKLRGELHHAQGFTVAFGFRLAEVAHHALLGVSSLLLANHGGGASTELRQTSDKSLIVGEFPTARQVDESPK